MATDPVEAVVLDCTIDGGTKPYQRHRCTCAGGRATSYNPREYRDELERVKWILTAERKVRHPVKGDVIVELHFERSTYRRVDVDNLTKTLLDAASGVVWVDDDQVVGLHVRKRRGRPTNRTRMLVRLRERGAWD